MDEIVMELLERLIKEKQVAKKSPELILDIDFKEEATRLFKDSIRRLWREKRIKLGRTINNNYITIQK